MLPNKRFAKNKASHLYAIKVKKFLSTYAYDLILPRLCMPYFESSHIGLIISWADNCIAIGPCYNVIYSWGLKVIAALHAPSLPFPSSFPPFSLILLSQSIHFWPPRINNIVTMPHWLLSFFGLRQAHLHYFQRCKTSIEEWLFKVLNEKTHLFGKNCWLLAKYGSPPLA